MSETAGGMLDFFVEEGDVAVRCAQIAELRDYVADPKFVKKVREISAEAKKAKSPQEIGDVTRKLMKDPRLTQCAMLGAGVKLSVDKEDLKKAARDGDIEKPSPMKADDLVAASKITTAIEAKQKGNEAFEKKNYARALAYWVRALKLNRIQKNDDEIASICYSNISIVLLRLDYSVRAEQSATHALAYLARLEKEPFDWTYQFNENDELITFSQRRNKQFDLLACRKKNFFRRACARERLRKYQAALQDLEQSSTDDPAVTKTKDRILKLLTAERKAKENAQKRKAEEKEGFKKRGAGIQLADAQNSKHAPGTSIGYVHEKDFSHSFQRKLETINVHVDLPGGSHVRVDQFIQSLSNVSVSVTEKRAKRSLYYELDIHFTWTAEPPPSFDLSPQENNDEPHPIEGQVRLYNVSHETHYEPGADPNVAYMYQLAYKGLRSEWFNGEIATADAPPWATQLINGAHELYGALAKEIDIFLDEFRLNLSRQ